MTTIPTQPLTKPAVGAVWLPEHDAIQLRLSPTDARIDQLKLCLREADGRDVGKLNTWHADSQGCLKVKLPDAHSLERWSLHRPAMYRLVGHIETTAGDYPVDMPIGFRRFHRRHNKLCLNDQPIYLRGCIRGITAHDHPNLSGQPDADWHAHSIEQAKRFGFNLVRWHSSVPPESYLDQADRLGIAVQVELGFEKKDGRVHVDREAWRDLVLRLGRHPSVAIYCVGNEIRRAGRETHVQQMVRDARRWNPSVLVTDSCGWGEPDRTASDLYIQHVAYFFPAFEHRGMFEKLESFDAEGSCRSSSRSQSEPTASIPPRRPVLAHEVCHYIAMRDINRLVSQWQQWRDRIKPTSDHPAYHLPKWVDQLRTLYQSKSVEHEEPELRRASQAFQRLTHRHALESIRRSEQLEGFQMLQLSDCWKYENCNGLLDSFDQSNHWAPDNFRRFNDDTVVVADLDQRVFQGDSDMSATVYLSHYGHQRLMDPMVSARLALPDHVTAATCRSIEPIEPGEKTALGMYSLQLPPVERPTQADLCVDLHHADDNPIGNRWPIWLFPPSGGQSSDDARAITQLTPSDLDDIERGASKLWVYRPADLFDPGCPRPTLDIEGRRELFKPVIWDRGDNLGAVVRDHACLGEFPHEGFADWQFASLIHHGCKINLDDFPVTVKPIIQGVGRPVRDRMDVIAHGHKAFQPQHTFRRWGWLFELNIGRGRLLVCGFNFEAQDPAQRYLLKQLCAYLDQPINPNAATISRSHLEEYLSLKALQPRPDEPAMTTFWLRDREFVETQLFWEELGITLK